MADLGYCGPQRKNRFGKVDGWFCYPVAKRR
jgi:hypothetical protein